MSNEQDAREYIDEIDRAARRLVIVIRRGGNPKKERQEMIALVAAYVEDHPEWVDALADEN